MDLLFFERNHNRYSIVLPAFVQLNYWNPFGLKKVKILDFSLGGFRLEFEESFSIKNLEKFIIILPLENFKIDGLKKLKLKAEVKWRDPLHRQVGGIYSIQDQKIKAIVENLLLRLAQPKNS